MTIFRQVGEISLTNNFDSCDILKTIKDKGFELMFIPNPSDKSGFKYGILIKEKDEKIIYEEH